MKEGAPAAVFGAFCDSRLAGDWGHAFGTLPAGVEPWEGDRVEPWSLIRKLTAEHMVMSRRVSPRELLYG